MPFTPAKVANLIRGIRRDLQVRQPKPRVPTPATRALNKKIDEALAKLKADYLAAQQDPRKTAIYAYLRQVYEIGERFAGKDQAQYLMQQVSSKHGLKRRQKESVFAFLLKATSTANRKTRSKWAHALEVASKARVRSGTIEEEIRRAGGLNEYVTAWSPPPVRHVALEDDWDDEDGDDGDAGIDECEGEDDESPNRRPA
jgi:hypothetical protein